MTVLCVVLRLTAHLMRTRPPSVGVTGPHPRARPFQGPIDGQEPLGRGPLR